MIALFWPNRLVHSILFALVASWIITTAVVAAPEPATSAAPTIEPSGPNGLGPLSPPAAPASSAPSPSPSETPSQAIENSVVKVFSTVRAPDPYRPWTKQEPNEISGSGAIISDKRILTNAHVVLYASQVQVQANQAGDRMSARVEAVAPGIDLAILKVDDESLFDSRPAIKIRTSLPDAKDAVVVYGYPTGGTSLSVTKGIISRIEFAGYNLSVPGLRIQIDAAINPGNSGGPAVVGEEMVGIAFSRLGGGTQNIGYIIPSEEAELFLKDIADGKYEGKPTMYDDLQTLENPALRPFLKIDPTVQGMIVHRPLSTAASYPLKEWDVITKIGEVPIDDQGMIKVNERLRVKFQYEIQKIAKQDKVPLTVVRNGKPLSIELPLLKHRPLVVVESEGEYPPYFIYGPIVLSEASTEFLSAMSRNKQATAMVAKLTYEGSPLITRMTDKPAFEGERLVVVASPFFSSQASQRIRESGHAGGEINQW
jgi:S1-C subfamily serine protease